MTDDDLLSISCYVLPTLPLHPAKLGSLFDTRQNVILGRRKVAEHMDLGEIDSILVIGKLCAMRRYLMTLARHWPGVQVSACPINYFGLPAERWHEHDEFRARVLAEYDKIPHYLQQDVLRELDGRTPHPVHGRALFGSSIVNNNANCCISTDRVSLRIWLDQEWSGTNSRTAGESTAR